MFLNCQLETTVAEMGYYEMLAHLDRALGNQRNRNSAIDHSMNTSREAGCGGVALGNVRPMLGDHRQHIVNIVITGNIINTGNDC